MRFLLLAMLLFAGPALAQPGQPPSCPLYGCTITGDLGLVGNLTATGLVTLPASHAFGIATTQAVYAGAAATRGAGNTTWVGTTIPNMNYFDTTSDFEAVSSIGYVGVAGASRTSDGIAGHTSAIGVNGVGFNNSAGDARGAWAFYGLAYRTASALGGTFGAELEIANAGSVVSASPYLMGSTGTTAGLWVGTGGEPGQGGVTLHAASCGVCIINSSVSSGAVFSKGFMIHSSALDYGGGSTAIGAELPKGADWRWVYDGTEVAGLAIRSDATALGGRILGLNGGIAFVDPTNDAPAFRVNTPTGRANSITVNAGSSTFDPQFNMVTNDGEINVGFGVVTVGNGDVFIGSGMSSNNVRNAEVLVGQNLADLALTGVFAHCSSKFLANGDACEGMVTMTGIGSSGAAIRMTSDGAAAGAKNVFNVPVNTKVTFAPISVTCQDITTAGKDYSWVEPQGLLTRDAGNAAYVNGTPTILSNGTVTGAAVSEAADTTNQGINVSFTPPTGNTDTWHCMASLRWARVR